MIHKIFIPKRRKPVKGDYTGGVLSKDWQHLGRLTATPHVIPRLSKHPQCVKKPLRWNWYEHGSLTDVV